MKIKSDKCNHSYKEECPFCIEFGTSFYIPNGDKIQKINTNLKEK